MINGWFWIMVHAMIYSMGYAMADRVLPRVESTD